jgi:hypothetical protein
MEQTAWRHTVIGPAAIQAASDGLCLTALPTPAGVYSDAQISDTAEDHFPWRPPLRLTVRARAEPGGDHLRGTAGFGFWNHPFMPGRVRLRLPQAVWFFFSAPPSNMALALDVPGPGWKAATFDAQRALFLALLPAALPGMLLMRVPALYRRLWPLGQRALGVSEHQLPVDLLAETHTYTLDWRPGSAVFAVDGVVVHRAAYAPRRPLGFIAWIDNQYAVVTPQGHFGFGLVPLISAQSLWLESVQIAGI